ncbi:PREDICTED: fasciclin-like arabinogalactan protein 7 [Tarenaya hassleriana]|uniref:fasciclin-like arabinogalactan protein 7 n=1 Tax=Tarenaya hassleriana TaxID=28532 RepID=UPI00053C3D79|nr:PREDICTED: fasciclin-like arabinogalactan protein 7 [Tarenaya hassleriana]
MDKVSIFSIIFYFMILFSSSFTFAKTRSPPAPTLPPTPAPAPAPAPHHVNLTELLSVAGPFHTFLDYLLSTKVIDTFQNQANNTDEGVTVFVPKDDAFKNMKNPSLSNLTQDQLKQLLLFHALPHYYSLSDFKNLSQTGSVSTFAGGQYTLNFTDVSGTVQLDSGWTKTKVSSSVYSTEPVAVYQVNRVLLPEAIFGTDIPPMPAPAPAPVVSSPADAPSADSAENASASSPKSSHKNSGQKAASFGGLALISMAVSGIAALY